MILMLDTDICVHLIREKARSIIDRFREHAIGDIGVSAVTLAELEYGVSTSSRPSKNKEALDQFVAPLAVAAFDRSATAAYGKARATLERSGQSIGAMDLLIAAHALALNVRLVTHNVREFRRVPGLRVEIWG